MEQVMFVFTSVICLLTPVILAILGGGSYLLAIGAYEIPGIARREKRPGKDWATAAELVTRATDSVAAALGMTGASVGLIGYMLPWLRLNSGALGNPFELQSLDGVSSGIALAFHTFLSGMNLLTEGGLGLGMMLLGLSLVATLIPLALIVAAAAGAGALAIPLGFLRGFSLRRVRNLLLLGSVTGICVTCALFTGVQASIGSGRSISPMTLGGMTFWMSASFERGFWVSAEGLALALVGAIIAVTGSGALTAWIDRLVALEDKKEGEEDTSN